jgi:hypothetical protein
MNEPLHRFGMISLALLTLGTMSGCAVVETDAISPKALAYHMPSCRSAFGAYYLPRRILSLHATAGANQISLQGLDLPPLMAADKRQPFCLDHLALPTSRDIVTVERDSATGLLLSISSDVEDRTPEIAKKLIATGENLAIAAARSGALQTVSEKDELHVDFDPFDWQELMMAKLALKRFGFCVYIEGEMFDSAPDAKSMFNAAGKWCSQDYVPQTTRWYTRSKTPPVPDDASVAGVLYRPNVPYKVVILRQSDPGRGPWTIYQTKRIEMPNVSPVMVVGVERAMFTKRETTLRFEQGVLTDVAVKKGSELEGFVEIPLAVAHAIVDVPAQIVQIRIADTTNQTVLLNAQMQLMDTISKLPEGVPIDRSARLRNGRIGARGGANDLRAGRILGSCMDAGSTPEACRSVLRDARR